MKKSFSIFVLIVLSSLSLSVHASVPTLNEMLQIQQSVNSLCLVRGQGRARILCRCAAVVVSNKLAIEGAYDYQQQSEILFEQSFEFCMSHEDKGFISATAKLYQSKAAIEESLKGNETKAD